MSEVIIHDSLLLPDGVILPAVLKRRLHNVVVFSHGLDPKRLDHETDEYVDIVNQGCLQSNTSFVGYTVRGHGASQGWQDIESVEQFHWRSLAADMTHVIQNHFQFPRFIVGGHSMGAATSVYCAIENSEKIDGMILVRPPCAWASRTARKKHLLSHAEKSKEDGSLSYKVLEGAAHTNLPPLRDDQNYCETYDRIKCPVLILGYKNDPVHPVETIETLAQLIPHAEIHIMEDEQTAKSSWDKIICDFLIRINI